MDETREYSFATNKDEAIALVSKSKVVFVIPRFGHNDVCVKIQKTEAVRLIETNWCDDVEGATSARLSKAQGYLFLV
jgi:hypothetical protein